MLTRNGPWKKEEIKAMRSNSLGPAEGAVEQHQQHASHDRGQARPHPEAELAAVAVVHNGHG